MSYRPPEPLPKPCAGSPALIFLAGSIEMGAAEEWQARAEKELEARGAEVLNPRRKDWDSSWKQTIANENFRGQVEWEMDGIDLADKVLMHFDPATKSPITLLEFGYLARTGKLVVSCPQGFWRRGNLEVMCARHNIPLFESLDQALTQLLSGDPR